MSDDKKVHVYLDEYGTDGTIVAISAGVPREAVAYAFNRRPDLDAVLHLAYSLSAVIAACGSLSRLDKENLSHLPMDGVEHEFITRQQVA